MGDSIKSLFGLFKVGILWFHWTVLLRNKQCYQKGWIKITQIARSGNTGKWISSETKQWLLVFWVQTSFGRHVWKISSLFVNRSWCRRFFWRLSLRLTCLRLVFCVYLIFKNWKLADLRWSCGMVFLVSPTTKINIVITWMLTLTGSDRSSDTRNNAWLLKIEQVGFYWMIITFCSAQLLSLMHSLR